MDLLAGISLAWTTIYCFVAIALVAIYLRFGRHRDVLIFAVICAEMAVFTATRVQAYIGVDVGTVVLTGRIEMAILCPAVATLLHLAMRRSGVAGRTIVLASGGIHGLAIVFMILSLAGLILDESTVLVRHLDLVYEGATLEEYGMTTLGIVMLVLCLGGAMAAGWLLVRSYRRDLFSSVVIATTFVLLGVLTANDILMAIDAIDTIYMVEHGTMLLLVGVLTTFLREFELSREELRQRTAALEEASRSLERLSEDLSESTLRLDRAKDETHRLRPMADLGRLSASLAHEIRNPLAVLSNVASTLRRQGRSGRRVEEFDTLVEMLQEETDRLARLVDDLLLFSQSGRVSREPVDASVLVDLAVGSVREQYGKAERLEIEVDVEPGLPPVPGSMESLRRACVNLIVNAIQSSGPGGAVRVIAQRNPDRPDVIMIGVEDVAGGIPEDVISEIFEPFFSTRPTGTGLGLSIVRSIVEAHDGDLVLENRPGVGATFWICLPMVS
jgi:signal transduction histidine kinase